MVLRFVGVLDYVPQEDLHLSIHQRCMFLDNGSCSHEMVQQLAILAEPLSIRTQSERVVPPHMFGEHWKHWPVRVNGTALVEQRHGGLVVVDDDDGLAEGA
jgi:hypothetical protein